MSRNSQYNMRPSWIKENLSQILLLLVMLMVVVSLAIYFFSSSLEKLIFADDTVATNPIAVEQPVQMITENWQEDPVAKIEDTEFSVGDSDLNDKRIVISKQELIGLEERYIVNVVDVAKTSSPEQLDTRTQQDKSSQPGSSIIKMVEPAESQIGLVNGQKKNIANQPAGISLAEASSEQSDPLDLLLTPADVLLAKPAHLFTVKLSELETPEKLLAFIGQNDLPEENVYIYQTSRNKQPWFVVIFGEYESFSAAKSAQQGLSASLSNLPAAITIYQEIHRDLQLNND